MQRNDIVKPASIDPKVGSAMKAHRVPLKLSQKDLANKAAVPFNTVVDYEKGTGVPDATALGKLERVLHVKLRGSNIGAPL